MTEPVPQAPVENLSAPLFEEAIERIIPHRYPFLLVDRVTEFVPGVRIEGVKLFGAGEEATRGYLPGAAQVPGVLLIEAVTQLGAILVLARPEMAGKIAMILQIPSAKMLRPVAPGETARLEAEVVTLRAATGELQGQVKIEGDVVATGRIRFAIADASAWLPGR